MESASQDVCDPRYGEVDKILEQLTKSKALHILMVLDRSPNPLRFSNLKELVDAPSTTVSRRLKELEDFGLVQRVRDMDIKATLYAATDDTKSLSPVMQSMFDWASIRYNRNKP
jgi:DNA-binding HxlR family transcriptional regulator